MTELKENAEKSRALSQMEDISKYLNELSEKIYESIIWTLRGDALQALSFGGYFAVALTGSLMDCPEEMLSFYQNLMIMVLLITTFRSWHLEREFAKAKSEWNGAVNVLRLLGMLPPAGIPRERKRGEVWSEGVAMVKSWFSQKKKSQAEAYA